jgi:FkbM family methyltransferase
MLQHYDFIEIGTSDFNTLIKTASDQTVGLSVEPLLDYLKRLPDRACVTKVNAAVSDVNGNMEIYYIPDDVRIANKLPTWVKGTNKIGEPHPTVVRYLAKHGFSASLITHQTVPVLSVSELLQRYNVGSIDYLKIDTEGHDCVIMNAYLTIAESTPTLQAKRIQFESNALSSQSDVTHVIQRLQTLGYHITKGKQDVVAKR